MSKIIGNITTTPIPRSDWAQTDKAKADFIRNKPGVVLYTDQELTAEQKAQAKENIGVREPSQVSIILSASSWENNQQTATIEGISADETKQFIAIVPSLASQSLYRESNIMVTAQSENRLTFTAETVPTIDLMVYIVVQALEEGHGIIVDGESTPLDAAAVLYIPQVLTEDQKATVRSNIGTMSTEEIEEYINNAVANTAQVQIITWEADD